MAELIVAAATPPGRGALAIVRLSGTDGSGVIGRWIVPVNPGPWVSGRARRVRVEDDEGVFDDGIAVFFAADRSPVGEPLVEVTLHGNPRIVERAIEAALRAGARLATRGEFTRRALVNGRLDLVGAEAVEQRIAAVGDAGLAVALAAADGRLGAVYAGQRGRLVALGADLEARLDHPDDELALLDDAAWTAAARTLVDELIGLAATARVGRRLVDGARVSLVGVPNAGKSSLFNAMLGRRRALVHALPGTTRDVVEAAMDLDGVGLTLLDTAGERETDDPVEREGLALAAELAGEADVVVLVLRAGAPDPVEQRLLDRTAGRPRVVVYNGVDRPGAGPTPPGALPTVARTGVGVPEVKAALRAALVGDGTGDGLRIASLRQRDLVLAASRGLAAAIDALPVAGPAVAADAILQAILAFDELTGADSREDVLDALFARFCIGK